MLDDLRPLFPVTKKAVYLNHAAIGPSPRPVINEILKWSVHHKAHGDLYFSPLDQMYIDIDEDCKIIGGLINARNPTKEIAFTYNTSYGLSAIAEAISWDEGDSIILNDLEYTSNSYTYQALAKKHKLQLKTVSHRGGELKTDDFAEQLDSSVRLVALSTVQFSNGFCADLDELTPLIHDHDAQIIVDGIQSLGAIPLDVQKTNIDYLAAGGYKWLLGPLGTGFLYVREDLTDELNPSFIGSMSDAAPMNLSHHTYEPGPAARRFQASLGPNAFLLSTAVNFLTDIGIDRIFSHVISLTDTVINFVEEHSALDLLSPVDNLENRSGIISFKCDGAEEVVKRLRRQKKPIAVSYREEGIRISPHCYNTQDEIQTCMETAYQIHKSL
ncbi:MAG: aminotransferase class V-fold PLP-dependent enzyme [Candidatus Hodarchaeales archaeon]|jgi:selenocysteine lyase/cysteine desulfurase